MDGVALQPLSAVTPEWGNSTCINNTHSIIYNQNNHNNNYNNSQNIMDNTCMNLNSKTQNGGELDSWSEPVDTNDCPFHTGPSEIEYNTNVNSANSIFDDPGDAFKFIDDFADELSQPSECGPWSRPPELDNTRWDYKNNNQVIDITNSLINCTPMTSNNPIGASNYLQDGCEGERDKKALNARKAKAKHTYMMPTVLLFTRMCIHNWDFNGLPWQCKPRRPSSAPRTSPPHRQPLS